MINRENSSRLVAGLVFSFLTVLLCGCSSPKAPEYSENWRQVNSFGDGITAVALHEKYTYGVLPMDTSLKSMVSRWVGDTKIKLDYRCGFDYSIPQKLLGFRVFSLRAAMVELGAIYGEQQLTVELSADKTTMVVDCPDGSEIQKISNYNRALPASKVQSPPTGAEVVTFESLLEMTARGSPARLPENVSLDSRAQALFVDNSSMIGLNGAERRDWPSLRISQTAPVFKDNRAKTKSLKTAAKKRSAPSAFDEVNRTKAVGPRFTLDGLAAQDGGR